MRVPYLMLRTCFRLGPRTRGRCGVCCWESEGENHDGTIEYSIFTTKVFFVKTRLIRTCDATIVEYSDVKN